MLSPGIPSSIGGTPKASAISRAAACFASMKSMSLGDNDIAFQSSPPSSSIGRPALRVPWYWSSSSRFKRSNWLSERTAPSPAEYTSAPDGRAALSSSALFHFAALLWVSIATAAGSIEDSP